MEGARAQNFMSNSNYLPTNQIQKIPEKKCLHSSFLFAPRINYVFISNVQCSVAWYYLLRNDRLICTTYLCTTKFQPSTFHSTNEIPYDWFAVLWLVERRLLDWLKFRRTVVRRCYERNLTTGFWGKEAWHPTPKWNMYQVFLCIFQKNSAMATLGLKEMGKFLWEGREKGRERKDIRWKNNKISCCC